MDNAWRMINDILGNLTSVVTGLIGLGVVAGILFGDFMGYDVIGSIMGVVSMLAENGVVGLLTLAILIGLLKS